MTDGSFTKDWQSGTCRANGIDVHYLRTGGRKQPVLALHGLIGSGACLLPMARTLAGDYDVILPDACGHGQSSSPDRGYGYPELSADVIGLIETLELASPVLIGHSMGGLTAAVVASRLGSAISGLVLVDPTFISPAWQREAFECGLAEEHARMLALDRPELLARARQRAPHRSDEMIQHLVDARLQTSMAAFEVLTPPNPDYRTLVRLFEVPTLLILAERGVVFRDTAEELRDLNPLLCTATVQDAGHGLPYDRPDEVAALIASFLGTAMTARKGREAGT